MDAGERGAKGALERSLRLGQVRAFNAVVRHGSFSEAARAIGVSQPAVTLQIRGLEEAAGGRVFQRGGAAELTPLGQSLLSDLRTLGHLVDHVEGKLGASRDLMAGSLAVGLCGPFVGMPLVKRYAAAFPNIAISTRLANGKQLIEAVRAQTVDVAVVTLEGPAHDLFNLLLATQRVAILAPSDHRLGARGRIRLAELEAEPLVIRERGSMTRQVFEVGLARIGLRIDPAFEFASREAVKEAVACGLGLGIVLDREAGADRRLITLTIEDAGFTAGEYLICPHSLAGLGPVGAFVETARTLFQPSPEPGCQETVAELS
ncbi:MAG: LysR substrate-binding domain-containing protein [Pseudomonadota bacterium]